MPDLLTLQDFSPHIGTEFSVKSPDGVVNLELGEAKELEPSGIGRDDPFSLIFLGPPEQLLDQQIHSFEHEALGALEIFIVPIGPDPENRKMRYQAIFS